MSEEEQSCKWRLKTIEEKGLEDGDKAGEHGINTEAEEEAIRLKLLLYWSLISRAGLLRLLVGTSVAYPSNQPVHKLVRSY
jgi:hypothetical protein